MKPRYLLAIIATMAVMVLFFWKDREPVKAAKDDVNETVQTAPLDAEKKSEDVIQKKMGDTQTLKDGASAPANAQDQMDEVQKNFSSQLRQMGQCLSVATSVAQDKVDPHFDNLIVSLNPGFGDVLVKMDDWNQFDVQTGDGSIKRVRTETEYLENNIPTKRVQLYKLNAQGLPELQPLSDDVAVNPTDQYLESLRADGRTVFEEKASRSYFAEGEELVVTERNGKVQSFSMSKGEKTFSCTETDGTNSSCQCL